MDVEVEWNLQWKLTTDGDMGNGSVRPVDCCCSFCGNRILQKHTSFFIHYLTQYTCEERKQASSIFDAQERDGRDATFLLRTNQHQLHQLHPHINPNFDGCIFPATGERFFMQPTSLPPTASGRWRAVLYQRSLQVSPPSLRILALMIQPAKALSAHPSAHSRHAGYPAAVSGNITCWTQPWTRFPLGRHMQCGVYGRAVY